MKKVTISQVRRRTGAVLSRVPWGKDIGIVHSGSGKIVALRPVKVYREDNAHMEYGLSENELKRAVHNITKQAKRERTTQWDGIAEGLRG